VEKNGGNPPSALPGQIFKYNNAFRFDNINLDDFVKKHEIIYFLNI